MSSDASGVQHGLRGLGERREAVRGDVVRDAEIFARHAVEEIAGNRFARRKADRMNETVEAVPALLERGEEGVDLRVVGDVAGEHQVAAELVGELGDAVLEALADIGERQLGAFALAGLRDAVGNRTVRQQAGQQDTFTSEKAHEIS